jgi:hypothetical protein
MDGGPVDVVIDGYLLLQVKRTEGMPSLAAQQRQIERMPAGGEMRGAVWVPPGRPRDALLTVRLEEFASWHGAFSRHAGGFGAGGAGGPAEEGGDPVEEIDDREAIRRVVGIGLSERRPSRVR